MEEMICEVKERIADKGLEGLRVVNLADSQVAMGAWAKGRSSAFTLNGSLRRATSWQILGRKRLYNSFLESAENVSDDPSRFVELRKPKAKEPWMEPLLVPEPVGESAASGSLMKISRSPADVPLQKLWGRELYAGHGLLTKCLRECGLQMASPFECYRDNVYDGRFDLESDFVHRSLLADAKAGLYSYLHFGIVCTSWGPAGRLSGGHRRLWCVLGCPDSDREVRGNLQAQHMQELIETLLKVGGYFSVENPYGSYLWLSPFVLGITQRHTTYFVSFD